MILDSQKITLKAQFAEFGQDHVFKFESTLPSEKLEDFWKTVTEIDLPLMARLYRENGSGNGPKIPEPIRPMRSTSFDTLDIMERAAIANSGMRALRDGKVAAFLVAGGQGTRLGHEGPKGMFSINLPSQKSLFQLQAERLLKLGKTARRTIPWYIMTSDDNHAQTVAFFEKHAYFGYPNECLKFFSQDQLPMLDFEGKIILSEPGKIAMGPNGNGGCFPALKKSGALKDMAARGVEWVFFYAVDNALVKVCDPRFLGFAMASNSPTASKAVLKSNPDERVGVFCLKGNRPTVLEYTELDDAMRRETDSSGDLVYGAGNIAIHLFRRDFLEANAETELPWHVAKKKANQVNDDGTIQAPTEANALKFELFMFDMFHRADSMAIMNVKREEEFAPVKNREGDDSPTTARAMVLNLHKKWAQEVGLESADLPDTEIEVSPLTSFFGEDLQKQSFGKVPGLNLWMA